MTSTKKSVSWRCIGASASGAAALVLALLLATLPVDASPEYEYTVNVLFQWAFAPCLVLALLLWPKKQGSGIGSKGKWAKWCCVVSCVFLLVIFAIPKSLPWQYGFIFPLCWVGVAFGLALASFLGASATRNSALASLASFIGSILLALGCMEAFLACTEQALDGLSDGSAGSKYVLSGQASATNSNFRTDANGTFPAPLGKPFAVAERRLKFGEPIFDVMCTYDAAGHRVTPEPSGDLQGEVLLFGCSFAFGAGLEDRETMAWQLGEALGEHWKVTNYGVSGFGPQQMLVLLEENMVQKPKAPKHIAIFWGLGHQVRRNAGLIAASPSVRYKRDENGNPVRNGLSSDSAFGKLFSLPRVFRGSQLVRHTCHLLMSFFSKRYHEEFVADYLAIIAKSSQLLREKHATELMVLVWQDLEYMEPAFQKLGIKTLRARDWLKDWESTNGDAYVIHPKWDRHPNASASRALARGLAEVLR